MKILIAAGIYPPDIGGPATYSKLIAEEFPRFCHETVVIVYNRRLPKMLRHLVYFWKALLHGRGADVIFAQDPVSVGLPAMVAAKVLRKKFVLKVVGDYAWEQGIQRFGVRDLLDDFLNKKYSWRVEGLRRIETFVARRAHRVITPSHYLKGVVRHWGVSEKNVAVIPNAAPAILQNSARSGNKEIMFISIGR